MLCYNRIDRDAFKGKVNLFQLDWGKIGIKDKPLWAYDCKDGVAFAVAKNAVVVAREEEIVALNAADGKVLWSQPLPAAPVEWGVAIDRDGCVVVTLEDGRVLCFG